MGKTNTKTIILGIMIAAVFILGILTIDFASANHPQNAGYRFTQFVEDLASHFPVTSADIVDGTIQGVDIATDAVVTIANLIMQGELDMSNNKISNLGTPTVSTDAATKGYVDSLFSCDGAGSSCVVGLGECQNSGINVCVMGSTQCSVSAGASSPEICDGLDNDCDGVIDNNAANASCIDDGLFCTGPELCQSGVCVSSGDPCAGNVGDNDTDCSESCDELASSCTANDPNRSACSLGFCDGTGTCLASVCGNGIVEPFEQCDDGNNVNNDDCTNSCLFN